MEHNKNNNRNVPNLRFPEFSGEWEENKLGDIAIIRKGATISKADLSEDGIPCILYGELYTKYRSEIINSVISRTNISPNNIVKSKKGDVIIPSSGETDIDIATARCVTLDDIILGGDMNIISLKNNIGAFFSYQLNGVRKKTIATIAQGSSVVHLYSENLKNLRVVYPSIGEQQKITSLLLLIDKRISAQIKIIEELESLVKGLCVELFNNMAKKSYTISDIGTKYSSLYMSKENLSEVGNKCILYGELFTKHQEVILSTHSKTYLDADEKQKTKGNDILFPSSTTVDAQSLISPSAICENGVIIGGDMFGIHLHENFNCDTISYILNHIYKDKIAQYAQGSTIVHLYYEDIRYIKLLLPSFDDQNKFAQVVNAYKTKIMIARDTLSAFQREKVYLLHKMFI